MRALVLGLVSAGKRPPLPALGVVSPGPDDVPPLYAGPLTAGPPVTLALLPAVVKPGKLLPVAHALSKATTNTKNKAGKRFTIPLK